MHPDAQRHLCWPAVRKFAAATCWYIAEDDLCLHGWLLQAAFGSPALGWCTVVIAELPNGDFAFVGWFVADAGHDSEVVSASGIQSSTVAEALAIVWALVWSLSSPVSFDL